MLEARTVELIEAIGVADRLHAEGLVHEGVELQFGEERHRIDFKELTGRTITVYGQQEVVKDLIGARLASGVPLHFEVSDVAYEGIDSESPVVTYRHGGEERQLRCDVIAGCHGFPGVPATT